MFRDVTHFKYDKITPPSKEGSDNIGWRKYIIK